MSFIGKPVRRFEDERLVQGHGRYAADHNHDGQAYLVTLRSPHAHARIVRIDTEAASRHPGVLLIRTGADYAAEGLAVPLPQPPVLGRTSRLRGGRIITPPNRILPVDRVRYVGEPVAVVLASSAAAAEDAADLVGLDIAALPAVSDRYAAEKGGALVAEAAASNEMGRLVAVLGDVEPAFAAAPYRRRERFFVQRHTAVMMEPRGLLAEWDAASGRLTVSGAAKTPFLNRRTLARQLGLDEHAISLVENDVGGGFGVRGEFYPEDFLIPFAAKKTGRPVKWVEDRREHFIASNHARDLHGEFEIACGLDGTILGLRGTVHADMGAYIRTNGATAPRNVAQVMAGPYRIPNIRIEAIMIATNKTPIGTYRGPGRFEGDFFRERLIDMAARDLGIDRVAMRRRNLIPPDAMPWQHARVEPYGGGEYDSGDYRETLDRCLAEFRWDEKAALQGKVIDGRHHGIAIGCYIEGGASGPHESARMVVEDDGRIGVYVGSSSVGQGIETIFAQIAADALELPMTRIGAVRHGSTTHVADGVGSHASRSTVMGGSAILQAASALKAALVAEAARRWDCAEDQVAMTEGALRAGDGRVLALGELAGVSAESMFKNNRRTYAYGAHAAHVAVDPRTGAVTILDYVAVEDVGRIINPLTLHGQAMGAIVQGLGGALLEQLVYDDTGQLLTGSLADYLLPTAEDFPSIRVFALESHPSPTNPLGAKGAGEGGIVPVGGVIANAVASALSAFGVEPHALPLSPQRVWALIEEARRASP